MKKNVTGHYFPVNEWLIIKVKMVQSESIRFKCNLIFLKLVTAFCDLVGGVYNIQLQLLLQSYPSQLSKLID